MALTPVDPAPELILASSATKSSFNFASAFFCAFICWSTLFSRLSFSTARRLRRSSLVTLLGSSFVLGVSSFSGVATSFFANASSAFGSFSSAMVFSSTFFFPFFLLSSCFLLAFLFLLLFLKLEAIKRQH
jgi:hypothetical protein